MKEAEISSERRPFYETYGASDLVQQWYSVSPTAMWLCQQSRKFQGIQRFHPMFHSQ